jgi:hypothetical protein
MGSGKFFHAGSLDGLVLDCYRLAKYYSRNPSEFLSMPMSEIRRHMARTAKLEELLRPVDDDDA